MPYWSSNICRIGAKSPREQGGLDWSPYVGLDWRVL